MTLSDERRTETVNEALRILMSQLANRALSDYPFMSTDSGFEDVLRTTWDELRNRGWIRSTDSMLYFLTGAGWKAGLKLTGELDNQFRERAFKLVAALKGKVVGRAEDAFVYVHDFEAEGIPGGFVFNVVESHILEELDPAKSYGLQWSDGEPWNSGAPFFRIPRTFGQRRLTR